MDGGWDPAMFFEPVPKCSPRLSNVLLRTVYVWAFEFVDNPALLKFVVPILGCHEKCFYCVCTFEVYLYSLVIACPFDFSPNPCKYGNTMEMFLLLLLLLLLLVPLLLWLLLV